MRTILILILSLSFLVSDDKLVASIDKTLQKVISQSKSKKNENIKVSYDPFNINRVKMTTPQAQESNDFKQTFAAKQAQKPLLSMILNKKAFINGQWYKEKEKFADYRIVRINQDIVVLKKNNKYTTLKLPLSDTILVTKEEIQ